MLSEDRQTHFAHMIVDGIWNDDLVEYTNEDMALKIAKRAIAKFVKDYSQIDSKVRGMIEKLKRNVPEGSPEWDVMYSKYFEEELSRHGG
ncbi:MAG: DUF507 family protein [Bdellovibrionales bacterium]|nr:DUF507 family protein [Bdellovibrionales bacterium]